MSALSTFAPVTALDYSGVILESSFVTATVRTASGNSYVVVTRSGKTTLVATRGPHAGEPISGDLLDIVAGCMWLFREGRCVLQSTRVEAIDIHEN